MDGAEQGTRLSLDQRALVSDPWADLPERWAAVEAAAEGLGVQLELRGPQVEVSGGPGRRAYVIPASTGLSVAWLYDGREWVRAAATSHDNAASQAVAWVAHSGTACSGVS